MQLFCIYSIFCMLLNIRYILTFTNKYSLLIIISLTPPTLLIIYIAEVGETIGGAYIAENSAIMLLDRDNDEKYDATGSIVTYNDTDAHIVTREEGYETAYEAALTPMSDIDL